MFGDSHGNVVHLFERDCSLQRRNQKVIEEAPAPGMSPELRAKITEAAVACAKAVGYEGAGTVEFLVEGGRLTADAPWYFIEMNTRLQVEHPVTEAITGLDLVEWQLRVASGERLPLRAGADRHVRPRHRGAAQRRGPGQGLPAVDRADRGLRDAGHRGLRVDAGVETGSVISPFYDSMIAKLIACGADRETAIARLPQALEANGGRRARKPTPRSCTPWSRIRLSTRGQMDTGLIGRELASLAPRARRRRGASPSASRTCCGRHDDAAGCGARLNERYSPWSAQDGFQLGGAAAPGR